MANKIRVPSVSLSSWRSRTALFTVDGVRSFAIGYFSIVFVVIARDVGIGALGLGILTGVSVVSGIAITHFLTMLTNRHGERVSLAVSGFLMFLTGVLVLVAHSMTALFFVALLGFLPPNGGLFIAAITEGVLAQTPAQDRTKIFARNGLIVTVLGAIGALFASFPLVLGMGEVEGLRLLTGLYGLLGIAVTLVSLSVLNVGSKYSQKSRELFQGEANGEIGNMDLLSNRSHTAINRLTILFIADSTGSGVVSSTLIIYWLRIHFGLSVVDLSLVFFGIEVLSALSFPLAVKISQRIGLLNTAVFTHIPSSILLIAVPFSPSPLIAVLLLLARALLVEMDVPTRKSYIASIVKPEERGTAAARTSMGKQAGRAIGPPIGGYAFANISATTPFVLSGLLKIAYDLSLWRSFRNVRSDEPI